MAARRRCGAISSSGVRACGSMATQPVRPVHAPWSSGRRLGCPRPGTVTNAAARMVEAYQEGLLTLGRMRIGGRQ